MKNTLISLLLAITAPAFAADETASVKLDFPSTDVNQVLSLYESLTHFKIIRDNFVQGRITISVAEPVTVEKAIELIESTLFANGFAIIQVQLDTVEIVGTGRSARSSPIPIISEPEQLPTHERLVSYLFRFKRARAKDVQNLFAQYLAPPRMWTSFLMSEETNTFWITERSGIVRQLLLAAAKIDVPPTRKEP
jgi:type II secretory pathway component GspD/PulD (secretin)